MDTLSATKSCPPSSAVPATHGATMCRPSWAPPTCLCGPLHDERPQLRRDWAVRPRRLPPPRGARVGGRRRPAGGAAAGRLGRARLRLGLLARALSCSAGKSAGFPLALGCNSTLAPATLNAAAGAQAVQLLLTSRSSSSSSSPPLPHEREAERGRCSRRRWRRRSSARTRGDAHIGAAALPAAERGDQRGELGAKADPFLLAAASSRARGP